MVRKTAWAEQFWDKHMIDLISLKSSNPQSAEAPQDPAITAGGPGAPGGLPPTTDAVPRTREGRHGFKHIKNTELCKFGLPIAKNGTATHALLRQAIHSTPDEPQNQACLSRSSNY